MPDNAVTRDETAPDESAAFEAGKRLKAAREAAGITAAEVNAKIHLSQEMLQTLEAGDFLAIGPQVFTRGHLRNYARFLKLPEEEILAAFPDAEPEAEAFRSLSSSQKEFRPGFSISNAFLVVCLLLVLIVAFIYLLSGDDEPSDALEATASLVVSPARVSSNNTSRFASVSDALI